MDKNPKIQIFKCDIFGDFQTLCIADKNAVADSDTLLSLKLRRFSTFLKNVKSGLEIPSDKNKKKQIFFPSKAKHDIKMAWSVIIDKLEIPTRVHCMQITQNVASEFLLHENDLSGNTVWPQAFFHSKCKLSLLPLNETFLWLSNTVNSSLSFVNATKRLSLRLQSINPFLQRVPNWIEFENSKEARRPHLLSLSSHFFHDYHPSSIKKSCEASLCNPICELL